MRDLKLTEISEKIDSLVKLLKVVAYLQIQDKRQTDQFIILSKAGFQPREIAELVGTTPNTVRVALSRLRKEGKTRLASRREVVDEREG